MKKISLFLIVACVAVTSGCTKWLDVEPTDRILEKTAFSTEVGANSVLNGIYRGIVSDDFYGYLMTSGTLDMLAHYYDFPTTDALNKSALRTMWDLAEYNYVDNNRNEDVNNSYINPMWNKGYSLIMSLNLYIDNMVNNAPMIDERRDLYLGEAYGLRAMLHLDLFRAFGSNNLSESGLPYHDTGTVVLEPYEASGTAFLGEVMKDLDRAEELLKANDPIFLDEDVYDGAGDDDDLTIEDAFAKMFRNKRMNYWAVQVLKARVNMLLGKYNEVITITNTILTEAVDPNYTSFPNNGTLGSKDKPFGWTPSNNNWVDNAILYDEVIFGTTQVNQRSLYKDVFATNDGNNARARVMLQTNLFVNIFGLANATDDINDAKQKDKRINAYFDANMMPGKIGPMTSDELWANLKYSDQTIWNASVNYPGYVAWTIYDMKALIRLSEVAYMNAEAHLKQESFAPAIEMINSVLARRGFQSGDGSYSPTNLLPATATAANIKDMLDHEYYREFQQEGQVFFYLKRNKATEIIRGNGSGKVAIPAEAYKLPRPLRETDFYE